jgi:hypothetical protein
MPIAVARMVLEIMRARALHYTMEVTVLLAGLLFWVCILDIVRSL